MQWRIGTLILVLTLASGLTEEPAPVEVVAGANLKESSTKSSRDANTITEAPAPIVEDIPTDEHLNQVEDQLVTVNDAPPIEPAGSDQVGRTHLGGKPSLQLVVNTAVPTTRYPPHYHYPPYTYPPTTTPRPTTAYPYPPYPPYPYPPYPTYPPTTTTSKPYPQWPQFPPGFPGGFPGSYPGGFPGSYPGGFPGGYPGSYSGFPYASYYPVYPYAGYNPYHHHHHHHTTTTASPGGARSANIQIDDVKLKGTPLEEKKSVNTLPFLSFLNFGRM